MNAKRSRPQTREPVVAHSQRLLLAELQTAIKRLNGRGALTDESVHSARQCLKRARAQLRLLRSSMGEANYQRENRALRNVAQPLTPARDTKALAETLDDLSKRANKHGVHCDTDALHRALAADHAAEFKNLSPPRIADSVKALQAAAQRIKKSSLEEQPKRLGADLERVYRRGRKDLSDAEKQPTDERLHELRKQVKYLGYALEALRPLRSKPLDRRAQRAKKLGKILGDDHDLALLCDKVLAHASSHGANHAPALTDFLKRRRRKLQRKALEKAHRLYATKPRRVARRVRDSA